MKNIISLLALFGGALLCHVSAVPHPENNPGAQNSPQKAVDTSGDVRGASNGVIHAANDEPPMGCQSIVFLDTVTGVAGKIGQYWIYIEVEPGTKCTFCLAVFNSRHTDDGRTYYVDYVGENCFNDLQGNGAQIYEIPRSDQLTVESSSKVAVIYPDKNSPRCIRMESNRKGLKRINNSTNLGRLMCIKEFSPVEKDLKENNMTQGNDVLLKGSPTVRAIVMGAAMIMRLEFGKNEFEGFAVIYMNERWGTMCDRWFHIYGWAALFCDQKDLPGSKDAYYTDISTHDAATLPINLMNAHCKPSEMTGIVQCVTREDLPCTHKEDLYVVCNRPSRLVQLNEGGIRQDHEGLCVVYEGGQWGTVCDHPDNPDRTELNDLNHFAHVCCRESGFPHGAYDWKYAMEENYSAHLKLTTTSLKEVTMQSPSCGNDAGETVSSMRQCNEGSPGFHCGHERDVFVSCNYTPGENERWNI